MSKLPKIVAVIGGIMIAVLGVWAFFGPRSFFDQLATFPPYNRHFIHDIGAFQIGIGAVLLLAVSWSDALSAALAGSAVGAGLHAAAHVWDRDLGGKDSDPVLLGLLAAVFVIAAVVRRRSTKT